MQTGSNFHAGCPFQSSPIPTVQRIFGNVAPQTGVVTLGTTDLVLPGRAGFDFTFGRRWKTNTSNAFTMHKNEDGSNGLTSDTLEKAHMMGTGWSSNLPYFRKNRKCCRCSFNS